jgi:hypothetical protein
MNKVTTELEALELCKKHQCEIRFTSQFYQSPTYVIIYLNAWTKVVGKDLIEAVNRLVDVYHTPRCDYEKLPWWNDYEKIL